MSRPGSPTDPTNRHRVAVSRAAAVIVLGLFGLTVAAAWGHQLARPVPANPDPGSSAVGPGVTGGPVADGFAADMLDHHDQAILIAEHAVRDATQPSVRVLATEVLADQRYEMGRLEQYRRDRGLDRPPPGRTVMGWMGMPVPFEQMPGLVPTADLVRYLGTTGPDVDRLFLELLIAHHRGGVHMAQYAADHAENGDVAELGRLMVRHQLDEIDQYQVLLDALTTPAP